MSSFWSGWIIVLTLGTLIALMILLRWNMKNFTDVEEGESMGHSFDGIEETQQSFAEVVDNPFSGHVLSGVFSTWLFILG